LRVTQALEKVPYVLSASTEYKTKQSSVDAYGLGCSKKSEKKLIQSIEDIGYDAKIVSNTPAKPPKK